MIFGIGVDLVEIERIQKLIRRYGSRFFKKLGNPKEIADSPKKEPLQSKYWASRFAAKEAFSKALGTGLGKTVPLQSVFIAKEKSGKPILKFQMDLEKRLRQRKIISTHLSLSHTDQYTIALVVLESQER